MHKTLTKRGYILNTTKLTDKEVDTIKTELTVTPGFNNEYGTENSSFTLYKTGKNKICVPRYYGIKNYGNPIKSIGMKPRKLKFKFKGKLRDKQQPIIKKSISTLKETGGGILKLHCGCGKTVLALYLACHFKLKTLIIVHKTFLQNQWYDRIKEFTTAEVGIIRQKKVDIEGKDIVVGMLQSISMIDYDMSTFKDFGLVVIDEVHHAGSRVFSNALYKTGCKYTLGLSATPYRNDGLTKILFWYLGNIMYKLERKGDRRVVVKVFNYFTYNQHFKEKRKWLPQARAVKPSVPIMISNIQKISKRNKFIVDILDKLVEHEERNILVLSGRIIHLKQLKLLMDQMIQTKIDNCDLEKNELTTSLYIGEMKSYEQQDAINADIIFASYSMAEEGLDVPSLNTLVLATPKKNIVQCVGRILRKQIKDGDLNPLIIDINDHLSVFKNHGKHRIKYYMKKKYTVQQYHAINDMIVNEHDFIKYSNDNKHKIIKQMLDETLEIDPDNIETQFKEQEETEKNNTFNFSTSLFVNE